MNHTDEDIIRAKLKSLPDLGTPFHEALDRILSRYVPVLPKGWQFSQLNRISWRTDGSQEVWRFEIRDDDGEIVYGDGPTIPAACEVAVGKAKKIRKKR
jgi:hypothetical protein